MEFPPVFLQRVRDAFAERVKYDRLQSRAMNDPRPQPNTPSIRVFISRLVGTHYAVRKQGASSKASFPLIDLSMTLRDLVPIEYRLSNGERQTLGQLMAQEICLGALPQLLSDVSMYRPLDPKSVDEHRLMKESLTAFLGVDERDVFRALKAPVCQQALVNVLFADLLRLAGSRKLSSFYTEERDEEGWYANGPALFTGYGQALKTHELQTSQGQVAIRVSRYTEETGAVTRPYEWQAALRANPEDPASPILAYACGMIYVGPSFMGERDTEDLLLASDSIADVDILQVRAFLEQDEAEEIWLESDLCFVWLWERAEQAAKGAGAVCLKTAIADLKKRFRSVYTVVFDCQPMQVKTDVWSEIDPPEIEEARLEATARLHTYITQLQLETVVNGGVLFISNIHQDDPEAAMQALAS